MCFFNYGISVIFETLDGITFTMGVTGGKIRLCCLSAPGCGNSSKVQLVGRPAVGERPLTLQGALVSECQWFSKGVVHTWHPGTA